MIIVLARRGRGRPYPDCVCACQRAIRTYTALDPVSHMSSGLKYVAFLARGPSLECLSIMSEAVLLGPLSESANSFDHKAPY